MHAIVQRAFGGPENLVLEEITDPRPGPGQARIAVAAAGVHLLDTTIREGRDGGPFPLPDLPMIPGREVAGTVDAVGPGVDETWIGRPVVAHLGPASGGYATRAVTAVDALIPLPDGVEPADAVAMVGTGRTALGILEEAAIGADDVVLVTAAAGGLGSLLVQAAAATGAMVAGVAGGPEKVRLVRERGAGVAVDYLDPAWAEGVMAGLGERRVSVALDGVGGAPGRQAFELVRPGGRMVMFGWSSGEPMRLTAADLFERGVAVTAAVGPRMLDRPGGIRSLAEQAVAELAAGRWTPVVHPPFPLGQAGEAHRALTGRATVGKVVLVP